MLALPPPAGTTPHPKPHTHPELPGQGIALAPGLGVPRGCVCPARTGSAPLHPLEPGAWGCAEPGAGCGGQCWVGVRCRGRCDVRGAGRPAQPGHAALPCPSSPPAPPPRLRALPRRCSPPRRGGGNASRIRDEASGRAALRRQQRAVSPGASALQPPPTGGGGRREAARDAAGCGAERGAPGQRRAAAGSRRHAEQPGRLRGRRRRRQPR